MLIFTLKSIAQIIEDSVTFECVCTVETIWLDFGAGIKGETIMVKSTKEYQTLNPRQLEDIQHNVFTVEELSKLVAEMNKRGW